MKKQLIMLGLMILPMIMTVMAVPVSQNNLAATINLSVTNPNSAPLIFLNPHSRVLFNDPYGVWENLNIQNRPNNYAFTGEGISMKVLIWDDNGKEDIKSVDGVLVDSQGNTYSQVGCSRDTTQPSGSTSLSSLGFSNVRRPSDTQDQINFNVDAMTTWTCIYTVTPSSHGAYTYRIQAKDNSNAIVLGTSTEYLFLNPIMDITISGNLDFGQVLPGQIATSNPIVITNNGEGGMNVQYRISGTDFYDPSSSTAKCSDGTNKLSLSRFTYSAIQGTNTVSDRNIPYGNEVSASSVLIPGSITSPGAATSITFKLNMPSPCKGSFSTGGLYIWSIAI